MGHELRAPVFVPEFFAVYFLAFASFVGLSGAQPARRSCRSSSGSPSRPSEWTRSRAASGSPSASTRLRGISFLIVVIGLFGIGELLLTMEEGLKFEGVRAKVSLSGVLSTLGRLPRYWVALVRGSLIGVWMGITPGGPTAASFMSYGLAKRFSRRATTSDAASRKASSRPRPPIMAPAPPPCCRCWRSASLAPPPRR